MRGEDHGVARSSTVAATLRTLGERWWIPVIALVLVAGLAYARDSRKTKLYDATATLLIGSEDTNVSGIINANASSSATDPQREQGTTLALITSSEVASAVRLALKTPDTADALAGQVSASAQADTNLVDVTARDPDARRAALLANTFARQYERFQQDRVRERYANAILQLQAQLDATPETSETARADISAQIRTIRSIEATTTGNVDFVGAASAPGAAASPKPKRDAALGGILGLALGLVLVFGVDLLDRRIKTLEGLEDAYGMPASAAVPLQRSTPRSELERVRTLEPFRILRSGLSVLNPRGEANVVLVTSAVPGEGKSTVASGLARAAALTGQRVVLVELDLRRPTFHEQFDLGDRRHGVTDILLGRADTSDVAQRTLDDMPALDVIAAGGTPARSAELLGSEQMAAFIEELRDAYDFVVLDAPPLLPVADTRVVLDENPPDVVLIVARPSVTGREQSEEARAILSQHNVSSVGLVVNGVRARAMRYEYGYDSRGVDRDPENDESRSPSSTPSA